MDWERHVDNCWFPGAAVCRSLLRPHDNSSSLHLQLCGNWFTDGDNDDRRKVKMLQSYAYTLQPSLLTLLLYHYYMHRSVSYGVRVTLYIMHEVRINNACM